MSEARNTALADRLFLSLRTCMTHPAGPLRAVVDLRRAVLSEEVDVEGVHSVEHTVRQRLEAMALPEDRLALAEDFLDVIFGSVTA